MTDHTMTDHAQTDHTTTEAVIRRTHYPAGVPCWIDLAVADVDAAIAFYAGLFGWEFEDRLPPDADARYCIARRDGMVVGGLGTPDAAPTDGWAMYVAVESADVAARAVLDAGGRVLFDPTDVPHAGRYAVCGDPSGALFSVWEAGGRPGAELVNAPGSWNFSDLTTPDPSGAAAFYGAVFGWEARTMDLGPFQATLLILPGYSDFLASIDPDVRRRHAEEALPEGFSDAVAWMAQGDDVRWGTTFAVDDTDGVAARAARLGGRVVDEPADVGPTRMAVVTDPWGTPFTVSHYQP
jgi:uncharacterized protein